MIEAIFRSALNEYPDRPFIVSASGEWTYAEGYQRIVKLAAALERLGPGRIGCHLPDSPDLLILIFAAGLSGRSLVLLNYNYNASQLEPLVERTDTKFLISDVLDNDIPGCEVVNLASLKAVSTETETREGQYSSDGEILILTSGTTGQPKCAVYQWSNLFAQIKHSNTSTAERWLLAYRLNHFAGVQMILHVVSNGGTLVIPESTQVQDAINTMVRFDVTHVSSTPTFWRFAMALLQENKDQLALKHLTLGSEAAPEDLLLQLHALFPDARIVHIYASTEAGSCVSVSDMKPGLPISVLDRPETADSQFRIVDDELQIKSLNGMSGYLREDGSSDPAMGDQGWRATGDMVRIENDRIVFVGRKNETINVGGVKVAPLDVENLISPVPGVKLVKAYGQKNPIVGSIVAVDVICKEGHDPDTVEAAIRSVCEDLVPAARPRNINFVEDIETNNLKLSRKSDEH